MYHTPRLLCLLLLVCVQLGRCNTSDIDTDEAITNNPGFNADRAITNNQLAHTCALHNFERRLYVSTVDGMLTALDDQGHILWSYLANDPLFSSTLSHSEPSEEMPDLIPGLDRALYHWDGIKLSRLPFTADDLIDHTPLQHGRGSALAGAKAREVVGINIHSGKPVYECSQQKCRRYDNQSLIQRLDVLKLSISRVTVREASEHTGEEMWNFTVGDVHLSLIEGDEVGEQFSCESSSDLNLELQVDTVGGVLYAVDRHTGDKSWKKEFSAPVVNVWFHNGGKLEALPILSQTLLSDDSTQPALMLVHYDNQYYVQHVASTKTNDILPTDMELDRISQLSRGLPKASPQSYSLEVQNEAWFDYSLESGDGEDHTHTALMLYYNEDAFRLMCTQGPNGLAVYFTLDQRSCSSGEENRSDENEQDTCATPSEPLKPENQNWLGLKHVVFSTAKYLCFAMFVLGLNKLHSYRKRTRTISGSSDVDQNNTEEFPFDISELRQISSSSSSASTPVATPTSLGFMTSKGSCSPSSSTETLTPSLNSLKRIDVPAAEPPKILPRFGSDYELKGRLGKGGFGVVYHVRNKTDGGEYAVKRIKLPTNKSSKDKVMREVHALAQLDHPRIVRYFHSWVEKAPVGWNDMEEWMPLSRRASYICDQSPYSGKMSSILQSSNNATSSQTSAGLKPPSNIRMRHNPTSASLNSELSPCPSFTSLNHSTIHSVVPPRLNTDSRSSSFVIEFCDDSQQQFRSNAVEPGSEDGCFSRALLSNRDELSTASSYSESTEDKEQEKRDSVAALGVDPPTYLFIQMQLCQKESLKDWLNKNIHNRSRDGVMHFFEQMLDAVLYVHKKGMMHRDLKPSNIFFSLEGHIKVGDFGLVTGTVFGGIPNSYLALKALGVGEDHHRQQHTGNLGTHLYMSPEQMSALKYSSKVDIFSLGVIFFELHYPFSTEMERAKILEDLRKQKFPPRFETHLPREAEFVSWLMAPEAHLRPSAEEIHSSNKFLALKENAHRTEVNLIPKL